MSNSDFIFIHIPKNAGRSIFKSAGIPFRNQHKSIFEYCKELGESSVRSTFKFTSVRNPWDRAVSWWSFFGNMGFQRVEFEQWIKRLSKVRSRPCWGKFPLDQMSFCKTQSGEVLIDTFMRFERIDEDFSGIAKRFGLVSPLEIVGKDSREKRKQLREVMLRSKHPELAPMIPTEDYHDMYTSQELIDIVARIDAETISRFGYTFD